MNAARPINSAPTTITFPTLDKPTELIAPICRSARKLEREATKAQRELAKARPITDCAHVVTQIKVFAEWWGFFRATQPVQNELFAGQLELCQIVRVASG